MQAIYAYRAPRVTLEKVLRPKKSFTLREVSIPELPEVETVVRDLRHSIIGRIITGLIIKDSAHKNIMKTSSLEFHQGVINESITTVLRKGKYILMPLSNHNVIVMHLGMTGNILIKEPPDLDFEERLEGTNYIHKHTHVVMELLYPDDDVAPDLDLHFNDPRTFGKIWLVQDVENINSMNVPGLRDLGYDALGISLVEFENIMGSRRTVKAVLLDQSKIAGVGNIYADESCFAARIHPARKGTSLNSEELVRLWFSTKTVLKLGIKYRGSSISDYVAPDGNKGSFQERHMVYGKTGQNCTTCKTPISKTKIAGRTTHFCPTCQGEVD